MSILLRILDAVLSVISNQRRLAAALAAQDAKLDALDVTVERIENLLLLPMADRLVFSVELEGHATTGATSMNLTDSQKATLTISPVDKKGAPATLDGVPVWATSDETVATVTAADDGLSATLNAVRPGSCNVTVTGDAAIGEETKPIVGTLAVSVSAGEAIQIDITAGAPEDQ